MQNFEITVIFVFIAFVRLKDAGTSQLSANRKLPAPWTRMNCGLLIFNCCYVLARSRWLHPARLACGS
jgi:hypothetical protein